LQKTLAGFDEMNIIQENGGTSVGTAGGGGITAPNIDLGNWQDIKIPSWVEWIAENGNIVAETLIGIAAGLTAIKLGASLIMGLGIGIAAIGIYKTIKNIIKFIKDPSWKNFKGILNGIEIALLGLGVAMVAFNATNPAGWILLAGAAIVELTTTVVEYTRKLFLNKAEILSVKDAEEQLDKARKKLKETTDAYVNAVDNAEQAERNLKEAEQKHKISGAELYKQVQNGTLDYKNMTEAQREVYKAYLNNKNAQDELKKSTNDLKDATKEETKASAENELSLANESKKYDTLKTSIINAYREGKISIKDAQDYFSRAMAGMSRESKQAFVDDLPGDIKKGLDVNKYESTWSKFKTWWNKNVLGLDTDINLRIYASGGGGKGAWGGGSGGGGGTRAKGGVFYPSKLPKLAVGGIINNPGAGVPYNGAIIGERGAEAVVPLTDSQQMALLGETIGKYITVNANITTTMNGRVISRELQKVQSNNDFAYNR
jgi:hypothetical protein